MGVKKYKLLKIILVLSLLCIIYIAPVYADNYEPYVPQHSEDQVLNVSLSGCSPPGTVKGCAACYDEYPNMFKQDCVYYFLNSAEQCSVVYNTKMDKDWCRYFVFRENVKTSDKIVSTCKLFENEADQNMCFMYLVPPYGEKDSLCEQIPSDSLQSKSYKESCYSGFAKEKNQPESCKKLRFTEGMIDCCTSAKGVKDQYMESRKDLTDSFIAKHPNEYKECFKLLEIKPPQTNDVCEDVNCQCLSPCNDLASDVNKQQQCAKDCAIEYAACYGEQKTQMNEETKNRFNQQSFFGQFSRKHCAEYKGSLAAMLKNDDHGKKDVSSECKSNNDCGEKRLCDACGQCRDEKELVLADLVNVTYEITPETKKLKMDNVITENTVLRVEVKAIYTNIMDGKQYEYCDLVTPGINKNIKLVAAIDMPEEDTWAGFTTGQVLDPRDRTAQCTVIPKDGIKKCPFILAPNDRKKPTGLVQDVEQNIKLFVTEEEINPDPENSQSGMPSTLKVVDSYKEPILLTMESAGPKLTINLGSSNQVQDGSTKVINFKVDDPDSKIIMVNAKVIGLGKIYMPHEESIDLESLAFTINPSETGTFVYKAPVLSNIDLSAELKSLSMTNLQTEAGKQILTDAAFSAIDVKLDKVTGNAQAKSDMALYAYKKYLNDFPEASSGFNKLATQYASNSKKAADFSSKLNTAVNTYKLGKGYANDLPGINGGISDAQQAVSVNVEQSDSDSGVSTTERVANLGVSAINVAQLGVSVLTFVPNKIPGVGKMTAGFQVAFSAATNIWKANFKYIAQDEKLGRAKELFVPVMILVTVEDVSGWQTQQAAVLQVAYHQIK
jgi:hypothetical protein